MAVELSLVNSASPERLRVEHLFAEPTVAAHSSPMRRRPFPPTPATLCPFVLKIKDVIAVRGPPRLWSAGGIVFLFPDLDLVIFPVGGGFFF